MRVCLCVPIFLPSAWNECNVTFLYGTRLLVHRWGIEMLLRDISAVDADSLGLADYCTIVKQPMDLSQVATKLDKRKYKLLKQVRSLKRPAAYVST